jgi:hypothetical protein
MCTCEPTLAVSNGYLTISNWSADWASCLPLIVMAVLPHALGQLLINQRVILALRNTIQRRQEAPQTILSSRVDIFYLPISAHFEKTGLFQQPQALSRNCGHLRDRDFSTVAQKIHKTQ